MPKFRFSVENLEDLRSLVDGGHHPEVEKAILNGSIGKLSLKTKHDWHSLREAMKCFKPVLAENTEKWESLVQNIAESASDAGVASFSVKVTDEAKMVWDEAAKRAP